MPFPKKSSAADDMMALIASPSPASDDEVAEGEEGQSAKPPEGDVDADSLIAELKLKLDELQRAIGSMG